MMAWSEHSCLRWCCVVLITVWTVLKRDYWLRRIFVINQRKLALLLRNLRVEVNLIVLLVLKWYYLLLLLLSKDTWTRGSSSSLLHIAGLGKEFRFSGSLDLLLLLLAIRLWNSTQTRRGLWRWLMKGHGRLRWGSLLVFLARSFNDWFDMLVLFSMIDDWRWVDLVNQVIIIKVFLCQGFLKFFIDPF